MKPQARFALLFFLPTVLASIPPAIGTAVAASKDGEYSPSRMFLAYLAIGLASAAMPAFLSALILTAAIRRGLNPKSWQAVGIFALLGLLSGAAFSGIVLKGDLFVSMATSFFAGWTLTAVAIHALECHESERTA